MQPHQPQLEPDEWRLLAVLQQNCCGVQRAHTQELLAELLHWPRRKVHAVCARLRQHGSAVGSSCGGADPNDAALPEDERRSTPKGMYLCETDAEQRDVREQLKGRLVEAYQNARSFGLARIPELDRQLRLFPRRDAGPPFSPNVRQSPRQREARGDVTPRHSSGTGEPVSAHAGSLFDSHPHPA